MLVLRVSCRCMCAFISLCTLWLCAQYHREITSEPARENERQIRCPLAANNTCQKENERIIEMAAQLSLKKWTILQTNLGQMGNDSSFFSSFCAFVLCPIPDLLYTHSHTFTHTHTCLVHVSVVCVQCDWMRQDMKGDKKEMVTFFLVCMCVRVTPTRHIEVSKSCQVTNKFVSD